MVYIMDKHIFNHTAILVKFLFFKDPIPLTMQACHSSCVQHNSRLDSFYPEMQECIPSFNCVSRSQENLCSYGECHMLSRMN